MSISTAATAPSLRIVDEPKVSRLDALDRKLLNDYQRNFPVSSQPYADIAAELGVNEQEVTRRFQSLLDRGLVTRIGPVFQTHRVGVSTLAAMAVPPQLLESVARLVNQYPEVNHNYEREHEFNLWFVLTAADAARIGDILDELHAVTGLEVLDLPLLEPFHIDLGFPLW